MGQSDQAFLRSTMAHFAALRARGPGGSAELGTPAFPPDWFDLPQETLADFGAMYFLMSLTSFNRYRSLAQITAQLEPPLRLGQYKIFRSGGYPRAFITWAGLNTDAEWRLAVEHAALNPEDWNSGPSVWVVDLVAPFGHVEQMLAQLARHPSETRLRTLWHNRQGTRARVMEWRRKAPGAPIRLRSYGQGQFARVLKEG